jgi:hypothetical protein
LNTQAVAYSDTIDRARYHIFSKKELFEHYKDSFCAVVAEYTRVKQLSPVVAANYDPENFGRSTKLHPGLIDWLVDVEHATTEALRDRPDLQAAWFKIALEEPVDLHLERQTIERCGRFYVARKLEPYRYHFRDRYPKRKGAR